MRLKSRDRHRAVTKKKKDAIKARAFGDPQLQI